MFTFLYGLRFRLFLLLGLALLPLLGLTLRTASAQRELAAAQAKAEALRMTRLVVSNQNTLTAGGHHLLTALAQLPEIRSGDPAECSALLAELLKQYPGYTNLGVAALNGDLLCSAMPTSGPINYADREWFQRVVQTRNFVVGEYVIGRLTGKATLPLAYPVMTEAGELNFVVFAGIDLAFVNQLVATAQFPEGTVATVLDSDGTILARYPDPEQWVGKTPQDAPIVQAILTQGEGTVETTGVDGVQRLYAFAPLGEAPHVEGYVSVGIPSQVAYAGVNRILFNNLISLGLVAILTFAAAWLGGEFFVLRRTRALARTAQQLTSGDLSARTGITRPRGELSQLGHAFDQMAAALQERQEALRKSEAHYRAVVEDQTELICRFKPDGTLTFVNENYCRYYGKTNDELIGNSFIPLAHGDQPKKLRKYLASFSRERPVATFEQQDVMPNGKIRWREWTDRAIFDKEGNIFEFQSAGSDISERKRAEKVQDAIYRISQAAVSTERLDDLYHSIHSILGELIPAENFFIALYDPVNDLLSFPYFVDQYDQPPLPEKAGHGLTAYVLRTGHSLLAPPEVFNQLVGQGEVELVGTNSVDWLGVPLNVEGKIIGVMVTQSYTEGVRFSQDEKSLLEFVSTQVAQAIERKRAEEALQRQFNELNVLHAAALAGAQAASVDELIERVTQIIGESLFPDNCGVLLFDETANVLRPHPSYRGVSNEENRHISIPLGKGVSGKVAASRRPLRTADVNREKNYLNVNMETLSELCVPILVGERLLGVLNAESAQIDFFTEADERLLVTIAGGLATAIEKIHLFDTERIRRLEAEMLSQTAATLTSSLELDQVLDNLLISLVQVIPYDSTAVFIRENERLRIVAGRGFSAPKKVIGQAFPADDPLSQALRESRRPILIADVRADSRFQSWGDTSAVRGWMGVPLIVRDQVIGYLTIDSHSLNAYNEAQANLALAFANQAAIAIENARLYTSLSNEKQRLELLYNLSHHLTESLDSHQVATKALDHICTALGAFKGVIYVPRPEIDRWELLAAVGMKPIELETFNQVAGVPLTSGLTGWAASHKKTAVVPDVAKDKRWLTIPGLDEWVRSAMATPLLAGNIIVGVLNLLSDQIDAFREDDAEIVQAAAASVAVALQNARLYAAEKRRAERLVEISKLGVEIAALHEASTVLNILVTRAAAIMESATCTVMLIDTITNEAVLAAQTGLPEVTSPELRIPLELPLLRHSVESSQPIIIPDINHDAPAMRAVLLRPDVRAFFAYPMLREGRAIGFITFSKLTPHTPSAEEVAACHLLAERAAVALENVRLFEETTRSLNQVQALHTIDMTIASSFDLRLTLNILLEQTKTQLGVDAVDVLIFNPHTQMLDYAAGIGFRTTALQGTHLRLGQSYAGIAGLERETIHISNLRGHKTDFLRSPNFRAEEFDTYFGVPLIAKGQLKGVLEVFHRSPLQPNQNWMDFLETLAKQAAIAIDNANLFSDLQSSNADLILAYNATIEGWSKALDLRDKETEGHTQRVTEMTLQLALGMGMGEAELVHVRRGALLHDIGKMGIPDNILHKSGPLTDEEWAIMRKHPQYVFEMLSPIAYLRPALDIPSYHHEKWDGTGYPRGLKGEQIPLAARIFAVVDVYDALISDRPYRKAWPKEKALMHIKAEAGAHFDPKVVEAFLGYSKQ